jgi:ABC-type sugar transport system substrate-binding protein
MIASLRRRPSRVAWGSLSAVLVCGLAYAGSAAATSARPNAQPPAQVAAQAALKDAAKLGAKVKAPTGKKIGFIHLSAQSASSQRMLAAAKQAAKIFGFKVVSCDPNFDPQKIQQCASAMVAQGAGLILSVAQEPVNLGGGLGDAYKRNIPWVGISGAVTPSKYVIQYIPDQASLTHFYDMWLFGEMKKRVGAGKTATLMSLGAPGVGLAARISEDQRLKDIKADGQIREVVTHSLDLTNIVQDTLKTTTQTVGQYPDLTGTWTICDFCVPLMAQALDTAGLTGSKRPVVSGFYTTPQTTADIRKGTVDGVVELPYEVSSWVAIDQAVELWARGKKMYPNLNVFTKAYSLKFLQPYIFTKANIGATGTAPILGPDFVTYFKTKWKAEFGVGGAK